MKELQKEGARKKESLLGHINGLSIKVIVNKIA
jgi:hypothetical protein